MYHTVKKLRLLHVEPVTVLCVYLAAELEHEADNIAHVIYSCVFCKWISRAPYSGLLSFLDSTV